MNPQDFVLAVRQHCGPGRRGLLADALPVRYPPSEVPASAEWQGGTLFITQRGGCFGPLTRGGYRYFISADGAQLIELVSVRSITGDSEQRLIFERQE